MSETVKQFSVEHQAGIDLGIYDPAFRRRYNIEAPGKGDEIDGVFYEILLSPAGLRSLGVNQLSKSEVEETYEGSTNFKRWQHTAGVYRMVRYFARSQKLDNETTLQYALIACLPDLGHGVKSHVTDMLKEGMGGNENFHEKRAGQIADLGGVEQILSKHSIKNPFDAEGRVVAHVPSWIESPSPGLCVDRLHYINAEISLMFPGNEAVRQAVDLSNIKISGDGELAFDDQDHALVWAKAANLCSSEHWNDPTNRLIELLVMEAMKRTIFRRYLENIDVLDNGYVGPPEDYTFLIDKDFDDALEREALNTRPDIFMNAIYTLVQSIGHRERQRFEKHKRPAYEQYLSDFDAREYPNSLINPHRAAFGVPPSQVEILSSEDEELARMGQMGDKDATLKMFDGRPVGILKKLKVRQFDPLVITKGGTAKLSELDDNFKVALDENKRALNYVGAVALHANPESQEALIEGVAKNIEYIEGSKAYEPLSPDQIRGIIKDSGERALALAIAGDKPLWAEL